MSSKDVDDYFKGVPSTHLEALTHLRKQLKALLPNGEECMSYAMPCIKLSGKAVAGYAAFKNHIGYFPHSGRIVPQLEAELAGRKQTTGGFQFGITEHLDDELVRKLIQLRIKELSEKYPDLAFDQPK